MEVLEQVVTACMRCVAGCRLVSLGGALKTSHHSPKGSTRTQLRWGILELPFKAVSAHPTTAQPTIPIAPAPGAFSRQGVTHRGSVMRRDVCECVTPLSDREPPLSTGPESPTCAAPRISSKGTPYSAPPFQGGHSPLSSVHRRVGRPFSEEVGGGVGGSGGGGAEWRP